MSEKFKTPAEAIAFLEAMPPIDIEECGPNGYPCRECEGLRAEVERLKALFLENDICPACGSGMEGDGNGCGNAECKRYCCRPMEQAVYVSREDFLARPDHYCAMANENRYVKVKSGIPGKFMLVIGGRLW